MAPDLSTGSTLRLAWMVCLCLSVLRLGAEEKKRPPDAGIPMTSWGRTISDDSPILPEYPRPQMVRERWRNLNGRWEYAITGRNDAKPATFAGTIRVPFAIESALSGVGKRVGEQERLWYRRTFELPAEWAGQRIRLHFGAVDWETTVLVNGVVCGTHRGGYDGFSFDITDHLAQGKPQELVVSVWDPTEGGQPCGKQRRKPGGIFYTPTTGIWQTVWLEPVPCAGIDALRILPDVDGGRVVVTALAAAGTSDRQVEVVVLEEGREVAQGKGAADNPIAIAIPKPRLWWPDAPFLYDLRITLRQGDAVVDAVTSYVGLRKISLGPDAQGMTRMLLNNQFIFHNGLLDQGYWPDGIYTAPTDEALRSDVEATRRHGFNMSRKHIKVEPDRWYYWADRLGLLVWQDMPCAHELANARPREGVPMADRHEQFETELRRMVRGLINHPSIVMWVVFNEGWGLEMAKGQPETPSDATRILVKRMTDATRAEDATRLINHESGASGGAWQGWNPWDLGLGDIVDFHCYGGKGPPVPEPRRAAVVGEAGWGVSAEGSVKNHLPAIPKGISGLVITQLTDVENETNGILHYDRSPKARTDTARTERNLREWLKPWNGDQRP